MVADIQAYAITHTNIMQLITVGLSYAGRPIWAAKISDNPSMDAGEPEVLFTFHQHAREHLTVEQGLYTLHLLTDNYGSNVTITQLVNTRVVWLFFDLNPDGGEYDITGGMYQGQRKNCQPLCDPSNIGTDLNRNWGYRWGYDDSGSSGSPWDETYRGPSAFSAPETTVISNFVATRVISGVQRIKVAIDFHTYSELVLWPYGYTYDSVPSDMLQHDYDIMQTMGTAMAQMNGYTPEQASALYLTNGSIDDWLYGVYHVYAFTFEMYPQPGSCYTSYYCGFYPPGSDIITQTERNRDPILYAINVAGNPDQVLPPPPLPQAYLPIVMR
jgi:carboxypeptidase T